MKLGFATMQELCLTVCRNHQVLMPKKTPILSELFIKIYAGVIYLPLSLLLNFVLVLFCAFKSPRKFWILMK